MFSQKATLQKLAVDDKVVIFGQSPIFMATLIEGGMPITAQHVNQVEAEAKKLIDLRNTAGKASNMASFIVALHNTMY